MELEEVIVTAQKREQRLSDVPMSISVVSGQVIEDLDISTALDMSYRVPGLVVQEAAPGSQMYTLRGVGSSVGSFRLVGVYLDEADVTSADPNGQYDLSLYDLARVEVLRGPQGTLYGAGSVGGTIRLITNKPLLDRFDVKAEGSVFSQARGEPAYELKTMLNTPLVEDTFGLRLAVSYHDWGGWIDQPAANRKDFNDNQMIDARLRALWRVNDRFEINGTVNVHQNDGGGANIVNLPPYAESLYQAFIDPELKTPYIDDHNHYSLTATYEFDACTLLSATAYTNTHRLRTGTRRFVFEDELIPGFPGSEIYTSDLYNQGDSRLFTQEIRLGSKGGTALNWTTGLFYRDEDTNTDMVSSRALGGEIISLDAPYSEITRTTAWAVFADISYLVNERWELGIGARYFEDDQFTEDLIYGTRRSAGFDHLSPRIYLSYAATDAINLYVNLAQGFRSGGMNQMEVEAAGGPGTYEPEVVNSYELGTKMSLADGRLYAEIAIFYSKYKDMQGWATMPVILMEMITNIGKARIQGFEWTLAWQVSDRFNLGFNGAVIDTEVIDMGEGGNSHVPGDPLDQVADYGWSVYADYYFNWAADKPGFLRAGYNRQGPIHLTDRSAGFAEPFSESDTLGFLYLNLGLQVDHTVIELFGRNLLDEDGISNPYGSFASGTQPRPRVFGIRLAWDFQ